jgi:hypothetical protein
VQVLDYDKHALRASMLKFVARKKALPPITASQAPELGGHMVLQTVRFVTDEERAAIMENLQKVSRMLIPTLVPSHNCFS